MPEDLKLDLVQQNLDEALLRMKDLEERMLRGEDVTEEEMTDIARAVAFCLQDAVDGMREMVGPEAQSQVEAQLMAEMSEEEFREWQESYALRETMRLARRQERLAKD